MNDLLEMCAFIVIVFIAFAALVFGIAVTCEYTVARPTCYAQWKDSGFEAEWTLYGGCRISKDGKVWISSEVYAAMQKNVHLQ